MNPSAGGEHLGGTVVSHPKAKNGAHRRPISRAAGFALLLAASHASATADFVCVADTPDGPVVFGDAADSGDKTPLAPPAGTPFLKVGKTSLDISQTQLLREASWYVFRDQQTKRRVFAMRRVAGQPDIPVQTEHPFCDRQNWRESCWSAELVFDFSGRTITVKNALCGVG